MGLGLQLQAVQLHSKLADLHAFSRFPDKDKAKAKANRHGNRSQVQFLNLGLAEEASGGPTREGALVQFSHLGNGGRRTCFSRRGAKRSSGVRNGGMRVVAALGESSRSRGLFWQPFWSNGGNSRGDGLEFQGGGGDGDGGDGVGGGGGRGSGGGGSGGFESSGEGIHESNLVEKGGRRDEEQGNGEVDVRSPGFRAPVLASLSSAAGDALDGEAPLGDLLLGRKKRAQEPAAKVPSRAPGFQGGPGGKENERDALVEEAATQAAHKLL